ncbi:MAG: ATP synthase F1 subunit epsilon [Pyrinomonadaceae bacterium]
MLKLEIVTPERRVLDETVESVTVPTASGEVGILTAHSPIVSALKPGMLTYTVKGTAERLVVTGGFVEVSGDQVSVLTDNAETAAEIDANAVRAERDAAQKELAAAATATVEENEPIRDRLDAANARLTLAAGR